MSPGDLLGSASLVLGIEARRQHTQVFYVGSGDQTWIFMIVRPLTEVHLPGDTSLNISVDYLINQLRSQLSQAKGSSL